MLVFFISSRTRSRSWRNVAVLDSKRPRRITKNTKYFLIIMYNKKYVVFSDYHV